VWLWVMEARRCGVQLWDRCSCRRAGVLDARLVSAMYDYGYGLEWKDFVKAFRSSLYHLTRVLAAACVNYAKAYVCSYGPCI
jgi:hypothetical protein